MASEKAVIAEKVQNYIGKSDWKSAIEEMERLFALDSDPIVRVRIGDARQKLDQIAEAAREYVKAADLYAEKGFVVKALALYKLALRFDPSNRQALSQMESLHSNKTVSEQKPEPVEEGALKSNRSVIPLFSDFTREEFNEFTKRMSIHTIPPGRPIIREGEGGNSVFVLTRGAVRVYSTIQGKKMELAVLQPSDFFGEIAFLTGKPRTATVETTEESDILEIAEDDLLDMIKKSPRIREVMQKYHAMRLQNTLEKVKASL